jgi:hypothetical protein
MSGIWTKLKKKVNKGIEHLAEEQKKTYGNQKLDCCDINKKDASRK